jgi:hypothetical protein
LTPVSGSTANTSSKGDARYSEPLKRMGVASNEALFRSAFAAAGTPV